MAVKKKKSKKRRISAKKVKENLDKKGFVHSCIALPQGMDFFKADFEKGKTTKTYYLNVIPFEAGKHNREEEEGGLWWRSKYDCAKNVGPEEVQVVSPRTVGKECPIWEAFNKLSDDPDVDDDDIKDLRPKSREMYYVIDTKDDDEKIFLLDISYFLFGKLLDLELRSEEGEDYMAFADTEDGYTLKIRFKQSTYGKATYQEVDKVDFVTRKGPQVTDEMIDSVKDPISLLKIKSAADIRAILEGESAEEDDDNEIPMDYPKGKKKSSSKNPKKKSSKKKKKGDQFTKMDRSQLKAFIRDEEIGCKVRKSMSDEDIRKAIRKEDW